MDSSDDLPELVPTIIFLILAASSIFFCCSDSLSFQSRIPPWAMSTPCATSRLVISWRSIYYPTDQEFRGRLLNRTISEPSRQLTQEGRAKLFWKMKRYETRQSHANAFCLSSEQLLRQRDMYCWQGREVGGEWEWEREREGEERGGKD